MAATLLNSVRRNHALEHGTVTMLLEAGARTPLGGYSTSGGFFIFGRASLEEVRAAAQEALASLQSGREELAISPHCGTNLATAALLGGLLAKAILARGRWIFRLPMAMAAVVGAGLLSRPIGNWLQRRFTTLAELDGVEITRVRTLWAAGSRSIASARRRGSKPREAAARGGRATRRRTGMEAERPAVFAVMLNLKLLSVVPVAQLDRAAAF